MKRWIVALKGRMFSAWRKMVQRLFRQVLHLSVVVQKKFLADAAIQQIHRLAILNFKS